MSLGAGRYFVRGRGADHLLEGTVSVRAGAAQTVDDGALERVEYARLVRKGSARTSAGSLELGYTFRSPFWSGASACQGLVAGWVVDLPVVSVTTCALAGRGNFDNAFLDAENDELGVEARLVHTWDLRRFSLAAGALGGFSALFERFDGMGAIPTRTSAAAHVGLTGVASVDMSRSLYLAFEVDASTTFFFERDIRESDETDPRAVFSVARQRGRRPPFPSLAVKFGGFLPSRNRFPLAAVA